jgi:hypothetical protein
LITERGVFRLGINGTIKQMDALANDSNITNGRAMECGGISGNKTKALI